MGENKQNKADQIVKNNHEDRIYFKYMQKVGAKGKYQIITIIFWSIISFLCGGMMLIMPFLFYQDEYVCSSQKNINNCHQFVCSLNPPQRLLYIKQQHIHSLSNQFGDFRCPVQKLYIDMIQSIIYASCILGYLTQTIIGNLLRRKTLMILCISFSIFGFFMALFSISIQMAGVGLFIAALGIVVAFNTCFTYICQTVAEQYRVQASVLIQFFYGLGALANVGAYYLVADWKLVFVFLYMIPSGFVLTSLIIYVKHTPYDLLLRSSSDEALKSFKIIASINGVTEITLSQQQIQNTRSHVSAKELGKSHQTFHLLDLFKFKSLRGLTVFLTLLLCCLSVQFYVPVLMAASFQFGIFLNGTILCMAELLAYPLCYYLIIRFPRKSLAYLCFLMAIGCSVPLIFLWSPQANSNQIKNSIVVICLIFIFRFFTTLEYTVFYVYYNELYPTQVRTVGTGFVAMAGGFMIVVNPFVISGCNALGLHIMIPVSLLCLLSLICSYFIPQTLNKAPQDLVQELRVKARSRMTSIKIVNDTLEHIEIVKTRVIQINAVIQ